MLIAISLLSYNVLFFVNTFQRMTRVSKFIRRRPSESRRICMRWSLKSKRGRGFDFSDSHPKHKILVNEIDICDISGCSWFVVVPIEQGKSLTLDPDRMHFDVKKDVTSIDKILSPLLF